jgi:hypothetical protein
MSTVPTPCGPVHRERDPRSDARVTGLFLSIRLAPVIGLGRSNPRSSRIGLRNLGRPFRNTDPFVANRFVTIDRRDA